MARGDCAYTPRVRVLRGCVASLVFATLTGVLTACATVPTTQTPASVAQTPMDEAALRAEFNPLIASHNARVAQLTTLDARGILEIRYRDETGSHFEQTDIELALASGGRGSLKLSKFGDLFWIGGDGRQAWIFDLRPKPPTVVVSEKERVALVLSSLLPKRFGWAT